MSAQQRGIHQLLKAEKKAGDQINDAKRRKQIRLKQARQEALAEIELFREECEKKFEDFQRTHTDSSEDIEKNIQSDTEATLRAMEKTVADNKDKVLEHLLNLTCDFSDEHVHLHRNLILQKELSGSFS
uniref:V-type proton ATPase subunit G n=1 Tax=Steinernema glaseri TaxID=37863 RepID=A0A1I7ZCE5_9BILA